MLSITGYNIESIFKHIGLFRMWLRQLPEPLFTFEVYEPLLKAFGRLFHC
jgi:hypothetical protein